MMKIGDLAWIREEYVGNEYLGLPKGIHVVLLIEKARGPFDSYDWEVLVGNDIVYLAEYEIEKFDEEWE